MSTLPRHRTVLDVMTRRVHMASPLTPFKLLVRLIEENHVSAIPIVDAQGFPLGIVSEADLLLKQRRSELAEHHDVVHPLKRRRAVAKADALIASDLMTSPPITVASTASLSEAARVMNERNVRRLVVVDERGKLAGIVSRSDILQVFLRSDEDVREDVVGNLIPSLFWPAPENVGVDVVWNVVTLTGEVDRKSDAEILGRMTRQVDGVVGVVNQLAYRWDDTVPQPQTVPL